MNERKQIDWEAVEREYRAGQLSVREIARLHEVSHVAIGKRAKKEGWTQNLAARVREEVTNKLVTSEVTSASAKTAVETAALRGVELVREHRADIRSGREMVRSLFLELREASECRDEIEEAIEHETKSEKSGKRRNMMLKAVSLSTRASVASNLAVALKNLVPLERQAFNLNADDGDGDERGRKESTIVYIPANGRD